MSVRLIALDMDGTLLGADHDTIPERNITALRAAAARGVKIALASGRTWSLLEHHADVLGVVEYGIIGNGSAVVEAATGKCLYQKCLPTDQAVALCRALRSRDLPFEVYCDGKNYIQRDDLERIGALGMPPSFELEFRRNSTPVNNIAELMERRAVEKVHALYVPGVQREVLTTLLHRYGPICITNSFKDNMEFTAQGVNKGTAIQVLCAELGISAGEVMAFGDADNDIEMLSWAEWSFAMANAIEPVKRAARYLAPSNEEAGVGQIVEKYVLN